ncbi:unnamed protein product [Larinioides sclopetarius]|uniref:Uncharacterized protein n=1 Tax=Larinioides sclopetarius TaxID=280406 RepID=A0AAV1Z4B0_9ARAC
MTYIIVNYDGMSPLHITVMENLEDCVNFLLNSKADVNLPEKKCGRISLHLSIKHPSLLQGILKQPNVDIDAEVFGGSTIVQLACLKTGKPFEVVSMAGWKLVMECHNCEIWEIIQVKVEEAVAAEEVVEEGTEAIIGITCEAEGDPEFEPPILQNQQRASSSIEIVVVQQRTFLA